MGEHIHKQDGECWSGANGGSEVLSSTCFRQATRTVLCLWSRKERKEKKRKYWIYIRNYLLLTPSSQWTMPTLNMKSSQSFSSALYEQSDVHRSKKPQFNQLHPETPSTRLYSAPAMLSSHDPTYRKWMTKGTTDISRQKMLGANTPVVRSLRIVTVSPP